MPLTDAFLLVLMFLGYTAALLLVGGILLTFVETLIEIYRGFKKHFQVRRFR